uniref:Uncharacterized protein n=1 Tax=Opuntia streptacantha TaxID=393608 RepID=A0A7C9A334_OPUST
MSIKYVVLSSYWLIVSNTIWCNTTIFYSINNNNYIMDTTKLLVKIGKKLEKIGLSDNHKPKPKIRLPKFRYPKYFGLDKVHHFSDPKFRVPEPKHVLVRIPEP